MGSRESFCCNKILGNMQLLLSKVAVKFVFIQKHFKQQWFTQAICLHIKLVKASLPIRHAGLGLRSTADLSLPCFLSSSHACKGLVNHLLPSLNLEIPYGDVNDAIDDWSKHHDSSPLEKGTQAAWDDLACRDTLNQSWWAIDDWSVLMLSPDEQLTTGPNTMIHHH